MRGPWLLLQLSDAAFPAGGFAHSGGLEALVQQGELRGADCLRKHLEQSLWQAGYGALPLVRAAHEALVSVERDERAALAQLEAVDARCEAFLAGHVSRRASRMQGRALIDTAARIFPKMRLAPLLQLVKTKRLCCHFAPSFGAVTAALVLSASEAQQAFLYQSLRGQLSAAVRLGILGPHEAQAVQYETSLLLDRVLTACQHLSLQELRQTAPLIDTFANTHDRLYSRLFLS